MTCACTCSILSNTTTLSLTCLCHPSSSSRCIASTKKQTEQGQKGEMEMDVVCLSVQTLSLSAQDLRNWGGTCPFSTPFVAPIYETQKPPLGKMQDVSHPKNSTHTARVVDRIASHRIASVGVSALFTLLSSLSSSTRPQSSAFVEYSKKK